MKLVKLALGASVIALSTGAAHADGHMAGDMTIVSWGGAYLASQQKAYHDPYIANTGIEIINDDSSGDGIAKLRAMREANNLTWDLVDLEAADAMRACDEGLAMEIDVATMLAPGADGSTAAEDFGDMLVSDCFIPQIVFSTTVGYRTDMVPAGAAAPTDACALFDTDTYPGKRALNKRPVGNMEWALLCDGVAYDDVYDMLETDEGLARAFAKLDTIKDDTVWWTAAAETPQLLADGEIFIGTTYNGRLFSAIAEQDQPIGMAWGYQMLDIDGWVIPTGLSDDRLARVLDYIYFATDTQRLADQAAYISYGPARASSAPLVGNHAELGIPMGPHMPTLAANMDGAFVTNYLWWADYRDEIDAKFQTWLAQ